jgi:hypothetical protein
MEAENLAVTSSGATTTRKTETAANGGMWVQLDSTAVPNSMTFTTASLPAGPYQVFLKYKAFKSHGQCSVQLDGTTLVPLVDQYSASAKYSSLNLGTVSFGADGPHAITLTVVGKNAASTAYTLSADLFTFKPLILSATVEAPTYLLPGGVYTSPVSVELSSGTPGASMRYTTNGTKPTATTGTLYTGPITLSASATLKAIAYKSGQVDSAVSTAAYTISAAAPSFSPGGSTVSTPPYVYPGPQAVVISTATSGASIRYTVDGTTPTKTVGTLYTGPVTLGANTTLKAIAYKTGLTDSNVTTATYTFTGN